MERRQTGQDRSSTSKVSRLKTVPAGQRYAMVIPSYFSSLSRFNAKKPSPYHHDMQGKTILAFRRIVQKYPCACKNMHRKFDECYPPMWLLNVRDFYVSQRCAPMYSS